MKTAVGARGLLRRDLLRLGANAPVLWAADGRAAFAGQRPAPPHATVATGPIRVRRTGWAGVQIEWSDRALFIDPKVKIAATGDSRRDLASLESNASSRHAAITHLHRDHFDVDALKRVLSGTSSVVCHGGAAATVASFGLPVVAVDAWEPYSAGDYEANAFAMAPAPTADGWGDPQVAWIVSAGGKRFFHGGDTAWTGRFFRIGQMYGPFEIAFLPINGVTLHAGIYVVDQPKTMTPEQAIDAAVSLRARRVVPIHYGAASSPAYMETADAVARVRAAGASAGVDVRVLEPAEWLDA